MQVKTGQMLVAKGGVANYVVYITENGLSPGSEQDERAGRVPEEHFVILEKPSPW